MSHYLVWDIPPPPTSTSRWLTIRKLRENIVTALRQKLTKVTQSQNMNIVSCRLSGSLLLASKTSEAKGCPVYLVLPDKFIFQKNSK